MRNNRDAVKKIFNDLDAYRDFCRQFGWVFNEKDLYRPNGPWEFYMKWKQGERVPNNWARDRKYDLRAKNNTHN